MSSAIVKPSTLDTSLLQVGEIQVNAKGGKSIKIGYNGEQKFHIRTPVMTVQFNVSKEEGKEYKPGQKGQDKYFVNMSLKPVEYKTEDIYADLARAAMKEDSELEFSEALALVKEQTSADEVAKKLEDKNTKSVADMEDFEAMMNELDDWLIQKCSENSLSWLKMKTASPEVVSALFNRTVKFSKDKETGEPDGKYPNTLRIRIPVRDDKVMYPIFDEFGNQITSMETVMKFNRGARISFILECAGVYFASGKFGYTSWQQFQARLWREAPVYNGGGLPKNVCLIDDDSDDEEIDAAPKPSVVKEEVKPAAAAAVEAPKKRVVRKKAT